VIALALTLPKERESKRARREFKEE